MMRFLVRAAIAGALAARLDTGVACRRPRRSRCRTSPVSSRPPTRAVDEDQRAHAGDDQRRQRERIATSPAGSAPAGKHVESASDTARGRGVRATAAGAATHANAVTGIDTAGKVVLRREVFAYEQSGRRDPFVSLMTVGELRPMISDLAISGILIDPTGATRSRSCAMSRARSSTASRSASRSAACASRGSPRRP